MPDDEHFHELSSGRKLRQGDLTSENLAVVRLDSSLRHFLEGLQRSFSQSPEHSEVLISEAEIAVASARAIIENQKTRNRGFGAP